jgi:hypothetical protein
MREAIVVYFRSWDEIVRLLRVRWSSTLQMESACCAVWVRASLETDVAAVEVGIINVPNRTTSHGKQLGAVRERFLFRHAGI